MVALPHLTESFAALDLTSDGTDSFLWSNELVPADLFGPRG